MTVLEQLTRKFRGLDDRIRRLERLEAAKAGIGARVYNSANISTATATFKTLSFDSERWDTDNIHDTVTNNERLTCNTAGKYIIIGSVYWATNTTGQRRVFIRKNGSDIIAYVEQVTHSGNLRHQVAIIEDMAIGDYVELRVYQNSGGDLNVIQSDLYSPEFMMYILP